MDESTFTRFANQMRSVPILSGGFRPFFLLAGLWAALAVPLWLAMRGGVVIDSLALHPLAWHAHELLYGYVPAVVAGFLLTAIPNWTGRKPITGMPLLVLAALWLTGRLALLGLVTDSQVVVACLSVAFLLLVGLLAGREVLAARNRRNYKVVGLVLLLFVGNVVFHVEAMQGLGTAYGTRIGVAVIVLLIALIGGRIVPAFTRNWLKARQPGPMPAGVDRVDALTTGVTTVSLVAWVLAPRAPATALLAVAACLLNTLRLGRWAGWRSGAEPLVWVLHLAFAFVPLGFALSAARYVFPAAVLPSGPMHAWMAGAAGSMTLAVMTRASLGHTGRPLTASGPVRVLYVLVLVAAGLRLLAALGVAYEPLLLGSAVAWSAAFAGFVIVFAPKLLARRVEGK